MLSHLLKLFFIVFVASCVIAGGVFAFTSEVGAKGYCHVLLLVCVAVAGLGAIFVYGSQGSRAENHELSQHLSEDLIREMQKDTERGSDLGLELFYSGVVSLALVYLVYRYL